MSNWGPIYLLPHSHPVYVLSFTTNSLEDLSMLTVPVSPLPGFHLPFFLEIAFVKCSGDLHVVIFNAGLLFTILPDLLAALCKC